MLYTVGETAKLLNLPASTLRYYDKPSVAALFEELLKKSVKSILGRYLCGRNNPKITHRFLCECYKINNYNLGM